MDLPNFKDVLKIVLEKLSVFRNNVPLLVSVIIALVAVLLFVPTQLLSSGLKKEMTQESIDNGLKKIDLLKGSIVQPEALKETQARFDEVQKDVNEIERLAVQTTERELLSDSIFGVDPNDPNSTFSPSVFYDFGRRYCSGIDDFIASHRARGYPTQVEVESELKASGIESIMQAGGGMMGMAYDVTNQEENIQGIMIDEICQKMAESTFVYIDPFQISGYDFWTNYQYTSWTEDIQNCWYSQLGYWVIQDIFDTIVAMNEGYNSVVDAPVKRLMGVNFSDASTSLVTNRNVNVQKYADRPQYIFSTDKIPKDTLTGRYSDPQYDVIHFKVNFVISTKDFVKLLKELCSTKEHKFIDKDGQTHTYKHNQITVLDASMRAVDMRSPNHNLCRYGDEGVSEVELTCEYLFNKKGYDDVMPQPVKDFFLLPN